MFGGYVRGRLVIRSRREKVTVCRERHGADLEGKILSYQGSGLLSGRTASGCSEAALIVAACSDPREEGREREIEIDGIK